MPLESGEIVRAHNHGTAPITLTYGGRDYVAHPDRETAVPFDAMVLWFGDPRSGAVIRSIKDVHGIYTWVPDRESEVRRLRIKWGLQTGDMRYVPIPGIDVTFQEFDGTPILTVVDDPAGDHIIEQPQTVSEVELLRNQILALTSRLDQQEAANRPTSPVDEAILESVGDHELIQDQAVQHFAHPAHTVVPETLSDIPYDTSTSQFTSAESAQAQSVTDTSGNKITLDPGRDSGRRPL